MTRGTVFDINTGRTLGGTQNLSRTFLYAVKEAQRKHKGDIQVVHGSLTHREMRQLIDDIRAMGVQTTRDMLPPDVALIIQGTEES